MDNWICQCGQKNDGNFCISCGTKKPIYWQCVCGQSNAPGTNFCGSCGKPQPGFQDNRWRCKRCNNLNEKGDFFCFSCGADQAGITLAEKRAKAAAEKSAAEKAAAERTAAEKAAAERAAAEKAAAEKAAAERAAAEKAVVNDQVGQAVGTEVPKKSGVGKLPMIIAAVALLAGGGFFAFSGGAGDKAPAKPATVNSQSKSEAGAKSAESSKSKKSENDDSERKKQEAYKAAVAANNEEQKKRGKPVFLVKNVTKADDQTVNVTGVFYNGMKGYLLTRIDSVNLDVVLKSGDKEIGSASNVFWESKSMKNLGIAEGAVSEEVTIPVKINLKGKSFDNYIVTTVPDSVHGGRKKN